MMGKKTRESMLVKLSSFFFSNWRMTLWLWAALLVAGGVIYTRVIPREGFPAIQFPLSVVQGTYFVDDTERVDTEVGKPLGELLGAIESVDSVTVNSGNNFYSAQVSFESGTDSQDGSEAVKNAIESSTTLPSQANSSVITIDPASFLNEFDMLLSVYGTDTDVDIAELEAVAAFVSAELQTDEAITAVTPQNLIDVATNPTTGEEESRQTKFNSIGIRNDSEELVFYPSVTVGLDRDRGLLDIIELSELVNTRIDNLDLSEFSSSNGEFGVSIGADSAQSIETQVVSLQGNLLSGLIAVAIVSFLLISWRASIITGLFMVTVMLTTVAVLYLVGYTLNTITLFALVLSLGLFVDDATIVVEAIDANNRSKKKKKPLEVVKLAISKIGAASFAGTFTTVLVFLPLAFLTGVLGEFIRLMPITIIIALITSLVLSLTVIPLLSKFFILADSTSAGKQKMNPIPALESKLASAVGSLPLLLKTKPSTGRVVAFLMVGLSVAFIMGAGSYANKLSFNIFPPTEDSDQIGFQLNYPEGYTLEQAQDVASQINGIVRSEIGDVALRVLYGSFQQPNARSADALIELVPFNEREPKSPELIDRLQEEIDAEIPIDVSAKVLQFDAGPPVEDFPLKVQITDEDTDRGMKLAREIQMHLGGARLTRANGTEATIIETSAPSSRQVSRIDGERTLTVGGAFDADDVSALLVTAETYVKDTFTPTYLQENGYDENSLGFDFGQESDNAESFASLSWAFPLALLMMFFLLAIQFRSALQPLLIFMAIPFTFFGVTFGMYITDNPISFFVMVGLIGLIGIAVNNTILLTDYANQERRTGKTAVEAISSAAQKRFRPLLTTTITTVVALLPLALSDPFWEALAFTIIFGLISSTILVVLSFPYYYLGAEWVRGVFSAGVRKIRKQA